MKPVSKFALAFLLTSQFFPGSVVGRPSAFSASPPGPLYTLRSALGERGRASAVSRRKSAVVYQWKQETDHLTLLKTGPKGEERVIWTFNFKLDMKPFFHPFNAPDGTCLTAEAPPDHLWHLGLWFCWKFINGLNYWEYAGDPKKAVSEGKTDLQKIKIETRPDGSADLTLNIIYHPWDRPEEVVMREIQRIRAVTPSKDGSYSLDFAYEFTAVTDVLLDRTPIQTEPNGVTWGGYSGLSIRFNQDLSNPVYFSPDLDSMISGRQAPWVAANLKNQKGKTVQLVILDDPANPRHPSPWYCINRPAERFWYYSPAILYNGPMKLDKGEKMTLKYRVEVPAKAMNRKGIWQKAEGKN